VILACNYEELNALRHGAHTLLHEGGESPCAVAAPPEQRSRIEALLLRLDGDLSIGTLREQESVEGVVRAIVECLRSEMDAMVLAHHAADEGAVAAYFDFAHALSVLGRVEEMGEHMRALIEVVTGDPADDQMAAGFAFPD
jgi:hypothetical protein